MPPAVPHASLSVRVKPGAKRNALLVDGDRVTILVRAPAAEGKANRAAIEVVAEALGVAKSAVSIARGQRSRDKALQIAGLSPDALQERLAAARKTQAS